MTDWVSHGRRTKKGRKGKEKKRKTKKNTQQDTATLALSREGADGTSCQQLGPSRSKYNSGVLIATNPKNSFAFTPPGQPNSRASVLFCFTQDSPVDSRASLRVVVSFTTSCSNLLFLFPSSSSCSFSRENLLVTVRSPSKHLII